MKLLTKKNLEDLAPLYSESGVAVVKFFTPDANWTWYASEYDPETGIFFGLVDGQFKELGYFTLDQLKKVKGKFGLPVERDRYFEPKSLKKLKEEGE